MPDHTRLSNAVVLTTARSHQQCGLIAVYLMFDPLLLIQSSTASGQSVNALLMQVMQLGSRFQEFSVQRASQVACKLQPQYQGYLEVARAHALVLDAAVADLEAKADTTHKQKADGEAFRGGHLHQPRLHVDVCTSMCIQV